MPRPYGDFVIDLQDIRALPSSPQGSQPEVLTRAEILFHILEEAFLYAGGAVLGEAHAIALAGQNRIRAGLGQQLKVARTIQLSPTGAFTYLMMVQCYTSIRILKGDLGFPSLGKAGAKGHGPTTRYRTRCAAAKVHKQP